MGRAKTAPWVIGTVLLEVVILVAAWLLLVAPKLGEVADTRAAHEDALVQQELLRQRLATLREQYEHIDEYRAELASLRTQVPADAALAAYVDELQALATGAGVTIVTLAPGEPVTFGAGQPTAPAPAPAEGEDGSTDADATADGDATDEAAPAPQPAAPTGPVLVSVPVTMNVVGTYDAAATFLASVQEGAQRLFLVTSTSFVRLDEADATGGRPAVADGDVELTVTGQMYVLPQDAAAVPVPEETTEPEPLPSSSRNPFAPVG